jgi:hypothetical protein
MRISNAVVMLLLSLFHIRPSRHHHQRGENTAAGSMSSSRIRERGNISTTLPNTKTEKASFIQLALSDP